jgi:hypothetical protein
MALAYRELTTAVSERIRQLAKAAFGWCHIRPMSQISSSKEKPKTQPRNPRLGTLRAIRADYGKGLMPSGRFTLERQISSAPPAPALDVYRTDSVRSSTRQNRTE